ncbi:MAG: ArgE/DapE family deacylase [Chloroflexi bacterium]|nr:ArgE/DapE family deacylase [Chloroflexota bacterium]
MRQNPASLGKAEWDPMTEIHTLIADLVAIDSVNPDLVPGGAGEARMAEYIADWGRTAGLDTNVQKAGPGRPNVILIARGSGGGKSLMLNAHTDVVGVSEMDAPFQPAIRDGRLYGRGAYDMKSGLAACMLAVKAARDLPLSGDVILSAVVDEEYGSIGTEALLAEWKRWPADALLIAEPTELNISIAHRGFVWLELETVGVAAHGSRPHLGVDAIAKMGAVLVSLDAQDRAMRANPTHELLGSGSLHASIISGGEEISMYPAHCKLLVERRTIPGETIASVEAEAQRILDEIAATDPDFKARVKATFGRAPFSIKPAHALVQQLKRVAEARLGADVPLIGSSWWMDSALFGEKGVPTVVLGPAGAGAHAREEWVDLESVAQCQAIYTDLIAEFCR